MYKAALCLTQWQPSSKLLSTTSVDIKQQYVLAQKPSCALLLNWLFNWLHSDAAYAFLQDCAANALPERP